MPPTPTLLLKARVGDANDAMILRGLAQAGKSLGVGIGKFLSYRGVRTDDLHAYVALGDAAHLSGQDTSRLAATAGRIPPFTGALPTFHRLGRVFALPGASAGMLAGFHYVVETDAADGCEEELFHWYDTEHMPGLAASPGCVRAQRFLNADGGPHSYACYDLTDQKTLESAAWLAVRHTAWSDRVRPNFRNTRRTMFRPVPDSS